MKRQRGLTIHFVDGTSMQFEFPAQTENEYAAVLKMKEVIKDRQLIIEVDGALEDGWTHFQAEGEDIPDEDATTRHGESGEAASLRGQTNIPEAPVEVYQREPSASS